MRYRFYGDELQLLRYEIEIKSDPLYENRPIYAASEAEKDEILERHPDSTVTEVDNAGFEWLDGMKFTQEQLRAGELEKAIELGEAEYKRQLEEADPEYRVAVLEEALLELASMIGGERNG